MPLYFRRWPVETKYDILKNKLELCNFQAVPPMPSSSVSLFSLYYTFFMKTSSDIMPVSSQGREAGNPANLWLYFVRISIARKGELCKTENITSFEAAALTNKPKTSIVKMLFSMLHIKKRRRCRMRE